MGFPLYFTCCFSLAAFNVLSLCLVFVSLISLCLGLFILGFILYGTLCASWIWLAIFFSMLGKFSTIIYSRIFSYTFTFSSSETPIIQMLVCLIWTQKSLRLSSALFILFTFFWFQKLFPPFHLLAHWFFSSVSDTLLLISSRVFLISVIVLFVSACLFFNYSRSLLIDSCIFSILLSRFLIIFTIIILNYFKVIFLSPHHLFGFLSS